MLGVIPLLDPEHRWQCPNCPATHITRDARPHTPFHDCPGLRGLHAPMVPAGQRCEVRAVEREDYIAGEMVHTDADGRAVAAIVTTRDDGNDLAVLAPCATSDGRANL